MNELFLCTPGSIGSIVCLRQSSTMGALPPNPRSFPHWANGLFAKRVAARGNPCRDTEASSPFGNVHRSGCPPAEPYPVDDARLSLRIHSTPVTSSATSQKSSFDPSRLSSFEPSLSSFAPAPTDFFWQRLFLRLPNGVRWIRELVFSQWSEKRAACNWWPSHTPANPRWDWREGFDRHRHL